MWPSSNVLVNSMLLCWKAQPKIFRYKTHLNTPCVCQWLSSGLFFALSFLFLIIWITFQSRAKARFPKVLCHILSCGYAVARQLNSAWGQKGTEKVHGDVSHSCWVHQNSSRGPCIFLLLEIISQVLPRVFM